ncbi:MAG: glutamine--fructose-6-phosphate transaminase (isomerizing), partial [Terriglobia bacterium]
MCGIVGYVGSRSLVPLLLEGLKRLEYRGYDSAGVAVAGNGNGMELRRASGKLVNLERTLAEAPLDGTYGLGHTRWATHGEPSQRNAHPHTDCQRNLAVVHNGIIENFSALKDRLLASGHAFSSDTDSEVIAHLIESNLNGDLAAAVRKTVAQLQGSFALAVISRQDEAIVVARQGAPVILGTGDKESFVASDVVALLPYTHQVIYLADGEVAVLDRRGVEVTGFDGQAHRRQLERVSWDAQRAEKSGFRHFMQKEIYEQPRAIRETLRGRIRREEARVCLCDLGPEADSLSRVERIQLVACGTSLHAALVGKWMIESLAGLPVEVDHGSEFRYRDPLTDRNTLAVLISQSGETADTLAAGREAHERGALTLALSNVPGSTLTRESDVTLLTRAGPEIGVASTKTFSTQLAALLLLALDLAQRRARVAEADARQLLDDLACLPVRLQRLLERDEAVEALARRFYQVKDFLFLGRGILYPIALEGALKLKEISYIHAEGCP